MAFQTQVVQNGQWVTQTVNVKHALGARDRTFQPRAGDDSSNARGLLIRSIADSPAIYWALPAQLRPGLHRDVALVGDNHVQISEFGHDNCLHHIARRRDFGSRIRNAHVLGNHLCDVGRREYLHQAGSRTYSDSSADPEAASEPQVLVLVLECGDLVFLFLQQTCMLNGHYEFVEVRHDAPYDMSIHPGHFLSVDPSSRYLAASTAEGLFIVYELNSIRELREKAECGQTVVPVKSWRPKTAQGVILQMAFLYPADMRDQIILALVVAQAGKSLTTKYQWWAGGSIDNVFANKNAGHLLPPKLQMPLLLIPLTVSSSYLIIAHDCFGVIRDVPQASPEFRLVAIADYDRTELHHGLADPLWACWARPYRRNDDDLEHDSIYLAREDGTILYLDLDLENFQHNQIHIGHVGCHISTAFTLLADCSSDVFIVPGDSTAGVICTLRAQGGLTEVSEIPNWSPTVDFITTDQNLTWKPEAGPGHEHNRIGILGVSKIRSPQRMFCTSGRGSRGAITEHRLGVRAKIGLDIDFGEPLRASWLFDAATTSLEQGYILLLALPAFSAVYHLSKGLLDADVLKEEKVDFDLSWRTVAASQLPSGLIVQVTEGSITIVGPSKTMKYHHTNHLGIGQGTIGCAAIDLDLIALSHHCGLECRILLARAGMEGISMIKSLPVDGDLACLAWCQISSNRFVVAGVWQAWHSKLVVYPADGSSTDAAAICDLEMGDNLESDMTNNTTAPPTSIAVVDNQDMSCILVLGSPYGFIVTIEVFGNPPVITRKHQERLGLVSADVFPANIGGHGWGPMTLACCDSKLLLLTSLDTRRGPRFLKKHVIIPVDGNNGSATAPPVNSVHWVGKSLSAGADGHLPMVMVADDHVLIADLDSHVGNIPWQIPVHGEPLRLLYSGQHKCLVVAVQQSDRPNILLLDTETGQDVALRTNRRGESVPFLAGLGHGDRIYDICEWLVSKNNTLFSYLLVGTKAGQLVILSTRTDETDHTRQGPQRSVRIQVRNREKMGKPIYSVAAQQENVLFGAGTTLYWQIIDPRDRILKPKSQFALDSPATAIHISGNLVIALTACHSMLIIDMNGTARDAMTLLHTDKISRKLMHMIDLGDSTKATEGWPITLLSDRYRGIIGVRAPLSQPGQEFHVVIEGEMQSSVRRFRRGHTRPFWASAGRSTTFARVKSTVDDAEIFGISLTGELMHFTLLNFDAWKLLYLVQCLALSDPKLYPFRHRSRLCSMEKAKESEAAHREKAAQTSGAAQNSEAAQESERDGFRPLSPIHGTVLQRILDKRAVESLVTNQDSLEAVCSHLAAVDQGHHTASLRHWTQGGGQAHVDLLYDILEDLLGQVL